MWVTIRGAGSRSPGKPMNEWTVSEPDQGCRLDAWLARRPELASRGRAREAIERGKVFLNGIEVTLASAGTRLASGDRLGLWMDRPGSARTPAREVVQARHDWQVVFEDEALLVVDKRPGRLVEPLPGEGGEVTLLDMARDHLRGRSRVQPFVVHRIDRDTSGLVLFALTSEARDRLKAQFERRTPERRYVAVVHGKVAPPRGTWRDRLRWDKERLIQVPVTAQRPEAGGSARGPGLEAIAHFEVVRQGSHAAVLEVRLVTGKRNQIRVQAGVRGHPLVGERIYVFGYRPSPGAPSLDRQALHAALLEVRHPLDGRPVRFEAPVPDDLRRLMALPGVARPRDGGRGR